MVGEEPRSGILFFQRIQLVLALLARNIAFVLAQHDLLTILIQGFILQKLHAKLFIQLLIVGGRLFGGLHLRLL